MTDKERSELIQDYLEGIIPEGKRKEVEQRINEDMAFRQDVELHRQLQQQFSDPKRWELRKTLGARLDEYEQKTAIKPGEKHYPKWSLGFLILALIVGGLFIWNYQTPKELPAPPTETVPAEKPTNPPVENKKPIKEEAPKKEKEPGKQTRLKVPIAKVDPADFIENPSMEALIKGGFRSGGLEFEIENPLNTAEFSLNKNGKTSIVFSGALKNLEDQQSEFNLLIFDNKDSNDPLFSFPLNMQNTGGDNYGFEMKQLLKAIPGLYYFMVEYEEGEILYAGKFFIKK